MKNKKYATFTKILSVFVGIFYMSWLVGYLTNPDVAFSGVASDLAVHSQPKWYLFLVFHGLLLATVSLLSFVIWRRSSRLNWAKRALFAYILFGIFTLASSIISLPCVSSEDVCGMTTRSYVHVAIGAAGISLLTASFLSLKAKHLGSIYKKTLQIVLFGSWALAIANTQLMLLGYSGIFIAVSQRIFLMGFAIIAVSIPFILSRETELIDN